MKVLLLDESWFINMIHQKGFDSFTTREDHEGGAEFKEALRAQARTVDHVPFNRNSDDIPANMAGLQAYECVAISEIGATTFLLSPSVFKALASEPNRLVALKQYVRTAGLC